MASPWNWSAWLSITIGMPPVWKPWTGLDAVRRYFSEASRTRGVMKELSMNMLMTLGVILLVLGGIGLAVPGFSTQQTRDVAQIGDLKVQTRENTSYTIPPLASGGVLVLGLILMGSGLYRRR